MNKFNHFNLGERKRIERSLKKKKSLRTIAIILDRSVSSISDEIRNNSVNGIYDAKKANHKAYVKRQASKRDCLKVAMDAKLQKFVIESMKNDQSPGGISGRLKEVEKSIQYASGKAIYKFIESPHGRQIEKYLYSKAVKKKTGRKRGTSVGINDRTFIDQRPKKVEKRGEFGHYEGDFIESGKGGKGSLLVIVERKTRYPFLIYLEDRSNANVNSLIEKLIKDLNPKSLTLDNDISFQKHPELSELINATIYFCHPQSPYEKGTIENRNKAIRRYVKKKSDLSKYSDDYFKMVETKLRNRFMKCLDYQTPEEAFQKEILKQKKPLVCGIIRERLLTS
jgi:IS30 family transposase